MAKLYDRIRDLREDHDMTQQQAAQQFNMHKTQYCRYETGLSPIPLEIAEEFAKFYNVSLDYLTGLIDTPRKLYEKTNK